MLSLAPVAGFKVSDIEVHIYSLATGDRKKIWEDNISVWEVYCGFSDPETMNSAAESVRDRWSFKRALTKHDYGLYKGEARFKVLSWDIDVGEFILFCENSFDVYGFFNQRKQFFLICLHVV